MEFADGVLRVDGSLAVTQFIVAVANNIFVVFPAMGRNYDAAMISAGLGGISLGATPTAMANMAAVTKRHGASHRAFISVPLVCAFFVDLANAVLIPLFLGRFRPTLDQGSHISMGMTL